MSRDAPDGWMTITDLANLRRVDKSAVSRRVAKFESLGLLSTRTAGKAKLVNLVEFDRAVGDTRDAVRELNGRSASVDCATIERDPVLSQEQARRVRIQADLAQIELDRALGTLVPVDDVREAMATAAGELVRGLETLPGHSAELAAAVAKDGEAGARAVLREIVRDLRERLSQAMMLLVSENKGAVKEVD